MKTNVEGEKYNRFLKRKELDIVVEHPHEQTPSMAALQKLIAKEQNVEAEKVEVIEAKTHTGSTKTKCLVFIWDEKKTKSEAKDEKVAEPSKAAEQEAEVVAEQVAEDIKEEPKKKVEEEMKEVIEEPEKK